MRRTTLSAPLALLLLLVACQGKQPDPTVSVPPTEAPSPSQAPVDESQFVVLPETGEVQIASSCQLSGPDGPILRAELENGGSLQIIRPGGAGDLSVSLLPSPEADPVGTNEPADTTHTEADGFLAGTSQLWLDDTDMGFAIDFRVRWDDSIPAC